MTAADASVRVCILAKAPVPGEVKTRLAAELGSEIAVRLARAFLIDTWSSVAAIPWALPVLATTNRAHLPFHPQEMWAQGNGDLGERLERVFRRALQRGTSVMALGADSPGLPAKLMDEARLALESADAVVGPAADGGFYLLGLRRCPLGLLSNLPWSTPATFERTVARLREFGLRTAVISPWFDVDRPQDLELLRLLLARGVVSAPETERALSETAKVLQHARRPSGMSALVRTYSAIRKPTIDTSSPALGNQRTGV